MLPFTDMAKHPEIFRNNLLIDRDGTPTPFGHCMDPWQREDFKAMDGGIKRLAGVEDDKEAKRRFYFERSRGHSKTTDIASASLWPIIFAPRNLYGIVAAGDGDQAGLLLEAIEILLKLNPWLQKVVKLRSSKLVNLKTGSELEVVTSDAYSAYGKRPDLLICDELTHWKDQAFWTALFSSVAKRNRCVVIVISNAGIMSSWQWPLYKKLRIDPAWHFRSRPGVVASWLTAADIAEQRRILTPSEAERLWGNKWTSGRGDAIPEGQIISAVNMELSPLSAPEPGWAYSIGLDLGIAKDTAGLALTGRHLKSGKYKLCRLKSWTPTKEKNVQIAEVEAEIVKWHQAFHFTRGYADPWQGMYLIQRLQAKRIPIEPLYFSNGTLMDDLTRNTRSQFLDGNIEVYNHAELIDELKATNIIESVIGKVRLEFPRSDESHGDRACSFMLSLFGARDAKAPSVFKSPRGVPFRTPSQNRRNTLEALANRD